MSSYKHLYRHFLTPESKVQTKVDVFVTLYTFDVASFGLHCSLVTEHTTSTTLLHPDLITYVGCIYLTLMGL